MSTVRSPRRAPAERAMLDYLRADAWRFDDPEGMQAAYARCLGPGDCGPLTVYELNVLYEMIAFAPLVARMVAVEERLPPGKHPAWMGDAITAVQGERMKMYDVPSMPFQLMISLATLMVHDLEMDPASAAHGAISMWRGHMTQMRQTWRGWATPDAMPQLIGGALARVDASRMEDPAKAAALQPMVTLACEAVLRMAWLFECEAQDALAFGPVSSRRLPNDEAEQALTLRRFAEQQPELRKVPAFIHVAPKLPEAWMRPRDYGRALFAPTDDHQTMLIARDALRNRRYVHDHLAVIEVDRKPIKLLSLAPEVYDRRNEMIYLDALVVHEKGTFTAEVVIGARDPDDLTIGLVLPFGSTAWRGMPDEGRAAHMERVEEGGLTHYAMPGDSAVTSLIIAAWRDLVVANVREQQYDQTVVRDEKPNPKRAERAAQRGHVRVVKYLPRMVTIRRAEEADRAAHGGSQHMRRAYRVGAFAKTLRDGTRRSMEAQDYAELIGMPLRDDQTIVRPHIRGGTEEEKQALLAQDDVRLWKSWAAVDLIFATRADQ